MSIGASEISDIWTRIRVSATEWSGSAESPIGKSVSRLIQRTGDWQEWIDQLLQAATERHLTCSGCFFIFGTPPFMATMAVSLLSVRASTYGAISTFFSVIFTFIAFSTPYWLRNESRKHFENLGLWEACFVHLRDRYFNYDGEFHGCRWLFDEDYAFLRAELLEPRKYIFLIIAPSPDLFLSFRIYLLISEYLC